MIGDCMGKYFICGYGIPVDLVWKPKQGDRLRETLINCLQTMDFWIIISLVSTMSVA